MDNAYPPYDPWTAIPNQPGVYWYDNQKGADPVIVEIVLQDEILFAMHVGNTEAMPVALVQGKWAGPMSAPEVDAPRIISLN